MPVVPNVGVVREARERLRACARIRHGLGDRRRAVARRIGRGRFNGGPRWVDIGHGRIFGSAGSALNIAAGGRVRTRIGRRDLTRSGLLPPGTSVRTGRAIIEQNIEMIVDQMQKMVMGGKVPTLEMDWYKALKVYVPPKELRARHPGFDAAWKQVKERKEMATMAKHKVRRAREIGTCTQRSNPSVYRHGLTSSLSGSRTSPSS